MTHLTGKHVNYYHICLRKLWLFDHGISMQDGSEAVQDGSLLHKTAYPGRAERYREIQLDGIRIDFYDPQERVVHEIKRSRAFEEAHVAQLQYYLWVLERHGIEGPTGVLEFPQQRRRVDVVLTDEHRAAIARWETEIREVVEGPCPKVLNHPQCVRCAYYEFCYAGEGQLPF